MLLDGKKTSIEVRNEIKSEIDQFLSEGKRKPHLAAILVGNKGASVTYVNAKMKACKEVNFQSTVVHLPDTISQEELLLKINELNNNPEIDGFIVQLPLPDHIDPQEIIMAVDPTKDVDGFHPINLGKMVVGLHSFAPATPYGILELLSRNNIPTEGKRITVLGRSNIVGKPVSILLGHKAGYGNGTITLCHSKSEGIEKITKESDIIIAAIGVPGYLKADMVKKGVVVIDAGITQVPDPSKKKGYKIEGDVDFKEVSLKASYITPVPGGVGPMTIAMLLKNTLKAYKENYIKRIN